MASAVGSPDALDRSGQHFDARVEPRFGAVDSDGVELRQPCLVAAFERVQRVSDRIDVFAVATWEHGLQPRIVIDG